ncbi:MAG: oligoribonuclease [Acidiferrobacteraceae bacterium]
MASGPNALVWMDLEMTGLNPFTDVIIEIATIITDSDLNVLEQGPVLAIHQPDGILEAMDEWNRRTHGGSGLVERIRASSLTVQQAEAQTLEFIRRLVPRHKSPLCGNSICQDRRFLARLMPELEGWLHYRNLDVSTLKELARRWRPEICAGFTKRNTHRALDDILESIAELKYYREHLIR